MNIDIYNKQKDLPISSRVVKKIVKAVLALEGCLCDQIAVYFVTTKEICKLHDKYFNDPSVTDCISFPMDNFIFEIGDKMLGEVFVCPETALHYAEEHHADSFEECTLYIVHGLLHLMGYDDTNPKVKAVMRKAEKKHMDHLKKLNLILKNIKH